MHPSGFHEDDDFGDFESYLPEGVTDEQATALVEEVLEKIKKLGLYCKGAHVAVADDDDESNLMIHAYFTFGKVAFTPRVQNPEQDAVNDEFSIIEHYESDATAQDIVESFKRDRN